MKNNLLFLFAIISLSLAITSCGDDDVMGCMDPDSNNFDSEATIDDGSCAYDRDPFLGDYIGSITFSGNLALLTTQDVLFEITTGVDATAKNDVIINLTVGGIPLSIPSTVTGNSLPLSQTLTDLVIPFMGTTITTDVTVNGEVMLDGTNLGGDLEVGLPEVFVTDTGVIDAEKQ